MEKFTYVIQAEQGIHARPAAVLVKTAGQFAAHSTIQSQGKSAELKSIFAVMSLGVKQGMEVEVTVEGADEVQAAQSLLACLQEHF